MAKTYTLSGRPCIVVEEGNEESLLPAVLVTSTSTSGSGTITAHTGTGEEVEFAADDIDLDAYGGIDFKVDGVQYFIRNLRETDAYWLSEHRTMLPLPAIAGLIRGGNQVAESLTAYAMDDSPYIVGVVYENPAGRWSRVHGDWNLLADRDDVFDGMAETEIHPRHAKAFVSLFDNNFVSVEDVDDYARTDPDEDRELPESERGGIDVSVEEEQE